MAKKVAFLMLRGLPASGKSTFAQTLVEQGWKRLNKDMMRDMIDGGVFSHDNEQALNEILYDMARHYLALGYNVVSDNCNLNPWHFRQASLVASDINEFHFPITVEVAVKDFHTPIETCIERDSKRPKPVTGPVIRKMADQWLEAGDRFPEVGFANLE